MKFKKIITLVITIISLFNSMLYAKEELPKDKPGTAVFVMSNNTDRINVTTEFIKEGTKSLHLDMKIPIMDGFKNKVFQRRLNKEIKKNQLSLKASIEKDVADRLCLVPAYQLMTNYHVKSNNDIFSLEISVYDYRGGAHGMSTRQYYNIDTNTSKLISLEDIVNIDMLNKEIQRQILERYKQGETFFDEALKFKGVSKNQSFYITNDGQLVIVFGLYEIAPYAAGILEFPIPKNE